MVVSHDRRCQHRVRLRRAPDRLVALAPDSGAACTLFCFHHAGGGAAMFRQWPRFLGCSVQLGTVLLPGREGLFREAPLTDFSSALARIAGDIAALTTKPYALFGHSLGAKLAFETAVRLERSARPPSCVIVSGQRPLHRSDPPHERENSTLPDDEFLSLLQAMGGTPPAIFDNPEMMQLFLPVIRADFRLAEQYRWSSQTISCPLLVLGGTDDPYAAADELPQWSALTTGPSAVRTFDGGHFYLTGHEAEVCGAIAAFLRSSI